MNIKLHLVQRHKCCCGSKFQNFDSDGISIGGIVQTILLSNLCNYSLIIHASICVHTKACKEKDACKCFRGHLLLIYGDSENGQKH